MEKSIYDSIFVIEDGVISISLKSMSLLFSVLMTGGLLLGLYLYCGANECSQTVFPMVEDTLIFDEQANRIFLFITTCFMWGVHQANIRAFYRMMYNIISEKENDFLLVLGLLQCVSLPCCAIFDKNNLPILNKAAALVLFASAGSYMFILSYQMNKNLDKFPVNMQKAI